MKKLSTVKTIIALVLALSALFLSSLSAFADVDIDPDHTQGNGSELTETESPVKDRKVTITCTLGDCVKPGDTFELRAELQGFEDDEYIITWEYNDGTGWKTAANSNTLVYKVVATEDTVNYDWRIGVEVIGE